MTTATLSRMSPVNVELMQQLKRALPDLPPRKRDFASGLLETAREFYRQGRDLTPKQVATVRELVAYAAQQAATPRAIPGFRVLNGAGPTSALMMTPDGLAAGAPSKSDVHVDNAPVRRKGELTAAILAAVAAKKA